MLTHDQVQIFDRDGFVLVEEMFSQEEIAALLSHLDENGRIKRHTVDMPDASGRSSKVSFWMDIAQDIFGLVTASPRIVNSTRMLLREDIYHWHSKVMLKEAKIGGAWEWHQDYGYWYHDGCLYPRMVSCMLALDRANRANGCLKVLAGSHHLGRIEHGQRGNQAGADPDRVAAVAERLSVVYCETPPGSVLFFHCNLLHSSEANTSDHPRRAYICCYNALSNIPMSGQGHGKPEPIKLAPDDALQQFAVTRAVSA